MPPPKTATDAAFHVYMGSDEARVKEAALMKVRQLTPKDAGDFSNDVIDGTADNADHAGTICSNVCMALQTLPFFGGTKVVWLKNANFLGDTQTGRAQAAVEGFVVKCVEGDAVLRVEAVLLGGVPWNDPV